MWIWGRFTAVYTPDNTLVKSNHFRQYWTKELREVPEGTPPWSPAKSSMLSKASSSVCIASRNTEITQQPCCNWHTSQNSIMFVIFHIGFRKAGAQCQLLCFVQFFKVNTETHSLHYQLSTHICFDICEFILCRKITENSDHMGESFHKSVHL